MAGTGIQAGAREREFAKEGSKANLVMPLASEWLLAVRALALLSHIVLDLLLRHHLLDTGQHLFGFIQS